MRKSYHTLSLLRRRSIMAISCIVLLLSLIISAAATSSAATDANATPQVPVNFTADSMDVNRELGIVTARGNVEVIHQNRTMLADTISYNQKDNVLIASGNITLLEPSGDVLFAQHMELTGDFKNGIIKDIRIILSDKSRLAASGGRRIEGDTELRNAVYSPCELCKEDPTKAPLWQLKAKEVFHDKTQKKIEYTDAWLEFAGYPILYTPYLAHPDPTVKRQSGFLTPSYGNSTDLGFSLKTPYFWNVSPQTDATLTPAFYTDQGAGLIADVRHYPMDGELGLGGSILNDNDEGFRGHIDSFAKFNIDKTWRWGVEANVASDDTYLRRYSLPYEQTLTSNLYAEGFRGDNYLRTDAFFFQGMEADDDSETTPLIAPLIDYRHIGDTDRFGGRTTFDASVASVNRESGVNSNRLSLRPGWEVNYVSRVGANYSLSATLDTDLYYVSDHTPEGESNEFKGFTGRALPQVKLDWRLPFVKQSENVHQIIEPITSLVLAPNGSNPSDIPNEDSQEFEFDETALFRRSRFAGEDVIEGGSRIDYGLQWGVFGNNGGHTTAFIGQSYRFHKDGTFADESGLEDNFSDFVAKIEVSPSSYIDVDYRTRISKENLSIRRNEINLYTGVPLLNLQTQYLFFDGQEDSEFGGREDMSLSLNSQFDPKWRANFSMEHDFADKQTLSYGSGLTYEDECLIFSTRFSREFFEDRDLQPDDTILFTISFKTLGDFQTNL